MSIHPALGAVLLRYGLLAAALLTLAGAASLYVPGVLDQAARHSPEVPDMAPPALPDPAWRTAIAQALAALGQGPSQAALDRLETTLISPQTTAGRTATRLTLIVPQGAERLALIDGRVFRTGDTLADGRRVHAISPQGVLLEAAGSLEMVPWIPPLAVRLERAASEPPAFANATLEAPAAPVNATRRGGRDATIDTQQALQLLRQLEAVSHAR